MRFVYQALSVSLLSWSILSGAAPRQTASSGHLDLRSLLAEFKPTRENPLRIGISGCMFGWTVLWNLKQFGDLCPEPKKVVEDLKQSGLVEFVPFCAEYVGYQKKTNPDGTPAESAARTFMGFVGGDGNDVLDGNARVVDTESVDVTDKFILGANAASAAWVGKVDLVILTNRSASCGRTRAAVWDASNKVTPQVQDDVMGVTAALLKRSGVPVISHEDMDELNLLQKTILRAARAQGHLSEAQMTCESLVERPAGRSPVKK